jgi:carbonic anhydrase/acetyltransferase-like protein (isoleucine patch superfamily)
VQDNVVIHVNGRADTLVAADVTIGHGVVMEGCTIEAGALLGMNATILSGAHVGAGALIGAGAVVREGQVIPANHLAVGVPAKVMGELSAETRRRLREAPHEYQKYAAAHAALLAP